LQPLDENLKKKAMSNPFSNTVLLIPAFNEEEALAPLLEEIREHCEGLEIVVINDASRDRTAEVAKSSGVTLLDLPINLGVAGAMQAGFQWALQRGYHYAVRCDSDGQHPPAHIWGLLEHMKSTGADLVIGSRALANSSFENTLLRKLGIGYLRRFLSMICRHPVTDPTSGFQVVNRYLMYYFANEYPSDYPEPESLALLRRQGYQFSEVGVPFRQRQGGNSSIHGMNSLYFAFKVTLSLFVDRARSVDHRYARAELEKKFS
jgi:glycosyltransferase involved in cell wall biosynthesis